MTAISETGIYGIEDVSPFSMKQSYEVTRHGSDVLRLPGHVQSGSSILYRSRVTPGGGEAARELQKGISALLDHDKRFGGIPSFDVPIEVPRTLVAAKHAAAEVIRHLTDSESPNIRVARDLQKSLQEELDVAGLVGARDRVAAIGRAIAGSERNLWIIVNPPKAKSTTEVLHTFKEGHAIRMARLVGLAVFEEEHQVFANPVVSGKRNHTGQITDGKYQWLSSYVYA